MNKRITTIVWVLMIGVIIALCARLENRNSEVSDMKLEEIRMEKELDKMRFELNFKREKDAKLLDEIDSLWSVVDGRPDF